MTNPKFETDGLMDLDVPGNYSDDYLFNDEVYPIEEYEDKYGFWDNYY